MNSVRAIDPSSANVLFRLLLPSDDQRISDLTLRLFIKSVHVMNCCSPHEVYIRFYLYVILEIISFWF